MSGSTTDTKAITVVLGTQVAASATLEATGQRELALVMIATLLIACLAIISSRLSIRARKES